MVNYDEIMTGLLSLEYVKENGVPYESLYDDYYWEDGVYHYERMFDKPRDEGGKPFSGIAYEQLGYIVYKDGYQCGEDVEFYPSGSLRRYSKQTETEHYIYNWHENGVISYFKENHRKDVPHYYRIKKYDENGSLSKQIINCEFNFTYDYNAPNNSYEVTWHENREFKSIKIISPTRETFYSYFEFDDAGYPIRYDVNPFYSPEYLSSEKYVKFFSIGVFDEKDYRFDGKILMTRSNENWYKYSGRLCFCRSNDSIEKIMEFKCGIPFGEQYIYYKNGRLKEEYHISGGKEYARHIWWYESGMIQKAIIYAKYGSARYHVAFDKKGNVVSKGGSIV